MSELTKTPVFPLQLFLLPGERTQLHIFEDRYKALMHHCLNKHNVFGLACNARENVQNLGSLVRISKVIRRYAGGEMDVEIECFGLFRLRKFFYRMEDASWPGGLIEAWTNPLMELSEDDELKSNEDGRHIDPKSVLNAILGLQLSLTDKLAFARISDPVKQNEFLESRKRLLSLLTEQEDARFEDSIYLN